MKLYHNLIDYSDVRLNWKYFSLVKLMLHNWLNAEWFSAAKNKKGQELWNWTTYEFIEIRVKYEHKIIVQDWNVDCVRLDIIFICVFSRIMYRLIFLCYPAQNDGITKGIYLNNDYFI